MTANQRKGSLPPDDVLLSKLRSSEPRVFSKAWQMIYDKCYPSFMKFALSNNGCEHSAADTFQDGMVKLLENIANNKYRGDSSIKAYLFGICRNLWLRKLQDNKREEIAIIEALRTAVTNEDEDHLTNIKALELAIQDMDPQCQKIIHGYYFENLSMEQLAVVLGVKTAEVAKTLKWRSMGRLRSRFLNGIR